MADPYTSVLNAGAFQNSKNSEGRHDGRRLMELLAERTPLVAEITALSTAAEEEYVGDVYVSTTGLSIAGGTKIYQGIDIYNCDPNVTYTVGSIVTVNVLPSGIGLIVVQSTSDNKGQHQGMADIMVTDNQRGWAYQFLVDGV